MTDESQERLDYVKHEDIESIENSKWKLLKTEFRKQVSQNQWAVHPGNTFSNVFCWIYSKHTVSMYIIPFRVIMTHNATSLPGYRPIPRWCRRCPGEPVGTRPLGPLGPCPSGDTAIPVWTRCPTGAAPSKWHTPSKTTRNWRTHRTYTSTVCRWRSGIGTPYPDDLPTKIRQVPTKREVKIPVLRDNRRIPNARTLVWRRTLRYYRRYRLRACDTKWPFG